jgi:uncharacterized protein (DUF1800 family)
LLKRCRNTCKAEATETLVYDSGSMLSACARMAACAMVTAVLAGCGGASSDADPPPEQSAQKPDTAPPPAAVNTEAFRFLSHATFGPTPQESDRLESLGYERWIEEQLSQPASLQLPEVRSFAAQVPEGDFNRLQQHRVDLWFRNAVQGRDQLRQRVAFALSEILVVSQMSDLSSRPVALAGYYDMLSQNAFGNFRQLMEQVALHPAMGLYLSMLGNHKPDASRNIRPDENFARELLQLFTIGLAQLNADGTVRLDDSGRPVPTYSQETIEGFAHVFTGWSWAGTSTFSQAHLTPENEVLPMQAYAEQHAAGEKQVLEYEGAALTRIPSGQSPQKDLSDALDNVFHHPNVGPFISRQLIQRLVTSNPSPAYVERVARVFADDGASRRGNLEAVVKAILLDPEALAAPDAAVGGKLKEPLLRITQLWRAYDAVPTNGRYRFADAIGVLGQGPLMAPSVFNFFSPSFAAADAREPEAVAPELQIGTEYLSAQLTSFLFYQALCYTNSPVTGCSSNASDVVLLDVQGDQQSAADSEALVARIAGKLLGGSISTQLKAEARAAVERVPVHDKALRVAEALFLIASSAEYAVQR